ncbi:MULTISPECIES: carbohydrate ABC transporter permease [Sphaerochaeta]|jgi:multiple sugar transport system permease protein|uniref:Carbohydrate ABC transporter permease n=2 Tax=root TaxID=1 RepID=A0ABY4D6T0_9SPIR|nr:MULTISPECIES: carbohydrate ABC transporter permease [Sphaerochaeta]MDT3357767.1 carbohydrate ABC transporter permease [Spirochaetota bacterium]MDD2396212.1 carbohydrate ABC transporter permease [Sphaerochaeta sp.]MDD3425062.1 carbohydrate ABC transporter permease [Sphaerochaeta sp.]MDD3457164.1 carbohydrate ABC transporter permease [Sphaerochaeta sp.]MDD4038956.1 carbohydrate ABC transporter permease [Sphaerochaeta sp.]
MQSRKTLFNRLVLNAFIVALGLGMLYPILWLIGASFKPSNMIFTDPGIWPKVFTAQNYSEGWKGIGIVGFNTFFKNSFIICLLSAFANAIFCSLTAYAFARLRFVGKKFWFAVMMITLMLPSHVTTIPRYIMFRNFGWINTFLPIIVPKFFATDAFFIFLLVQFIRGLPRDIDESALIDGCSKFGIYTRIIMPLTVPALITTLLFSFLWTWDDFFNQLLYLTSPNRYTVPMGLRLFLDSSGMSSWGPMFAMSVLSLIPAFTLFFSLQKYFVRGIATTGIKG